MNVSLKASSWQRKALVPALTALTALTLLGAGCSQQKVPQQAADRQALAADSLHMARLYSQWTRSAQAQAARPGASKREMPIDLSDDAQFRFVKNRLMASGSTPENAPQLFKRLEKLRKQKTTGVPVRTRKSALGATSTVESGLEEEPPKCGQFMGLNDVKAEDSTQARFKAFSLVTCFDGSDYAYTDVNAFATNAERTQFRLLGSEFYEDYAGATLETLPLDISVPANPDEVLVVDSMALAFDEETGESHLSYSVEEASLARWDVNELLIEHPIELSGHQYTSYMDNPIRTCLERGGVEGYLDCDYAAGHKDPVTGDFQPFSAPYTGVAAIDPEASSGGKWVGHRTNYWEPVSGPYESARLYIPLRGAYRTKPGSRMTCEGDFKVETLTSSAWVVLRERGGRCSAGQAPGTRVLDGSLPFTTQTWDANNPQVLVAGFNGLEDFGSDCVDNMQNVDLYLFARVQASCGGTLLTPRARYLAIRNLDFRNACLAEGTQVVKADGTKVPVEAVKVGDKLLANGNGLALTVTTVSRGGESKPMVKLRDTTGGEVMVTETHPLVTAMRGVVQASELKAGDVLRTRDGARKLAAVERVPYDGQVYNFALGTPEELAGVGPEARTLYANGFLVGDSHMQSTLEKVRKLDTREVLSRLHRAWHKDYRLDRAKLKSALR